MKRPEPMSESYYYILVCLAKSPNHGYGIMQMAKELSGDEVIIGSGTMYGATGNMMKKGWIQEIVTDDTGSMRRRMYALTAEGREALKSEIERLRKMAAIGEDI